MGGNGGTIVTESHTGADTYAIRWVLKSKSRTLKLATALENRDACTDRPDV